LSNPSTFSEKFEVTVSYQDTRWNIRLSTEERDLVLPHLDQFSKRLLKRHLKIGKSPIDSPLVLASAFLEYLSRPGIPEDALRIVLRIFERHFLLDADIHNLAFRLEDPEQANLLKTYYTALEKTDSPGSSAKSALFEAAQKGHAHLYAVFGGQGAGNPLCLKDLSQVYSIYGYFLEQLVDVAADTLKKLSSSRRASTFYEKLEFDLKRWLTEPASMPSPTIVAASPLSFPIIGLLGLAHYCITCKSLGKHPGQVRDSFRGVTGHSQGIVIAAAVARSGSWNAFYDSVTMVMEMLFWIGFESHVATAPSSLTKADNTDSIRSGEGQPSVMLGVRGLNQMTLQNLIDETNSEVSKRDRLYLALINSRDNMVVSGPQGSLRALSLRLRKLRGDGDERHTAIQNRYLPISAPFHSPHLNNAVDRVMEVLGTSSFLDGRLRLDLYHTGTGEDLRRKGLGDLKRSLIQMVMTEKVDWPKASSFTKATHIIDFGPGRIGLLQNQLTEGTGVRVIIASDMRSVTEGVGSKEELFSSSLPPPATNWGQVFGPKLVKDSNGEAKFQTRMTTLLDAPPVMVAGTSPTATPWNFVVAVMKAGYHVELATSDYHDEKGFEEAICKIAQKFPTGRGITCNLVDTSSSALVWQVPLIQRLIAKTLPVEGLTLGDEPSIKTVKNYIEVIGLKHISFQLDSSRSILELVKIAKEYPNFRFGLQWIGGKAGNASLEEFHNPIIKNYGQIRKCPNIFLIISGGFGGPDDTYPYLTGEWAEPLGYPRMPFDGVLLGSRMVSKESHASIPAKNLIVETEGMCEDEWHKSYDRSMGRIITVLSESGQPLHALATRGILLWKHLDETIFSIKNPVKRFTKIVRNREDIINRLNKDFQKPWFGVDWMGNNVDLSSMTYLEVLHRLVSLMYVRSRNRWIDESYENFVLDFAARAQKSLVMLSPFNLPRRLEDPFEFLTDFLNCYPTAEGEQLSSEDVLHFMTLCTRAGQKPVNFIPRLDEDFERWFKEDCLWYAEHIDAVPYQDVQRVCVMHSPIAARSSKVVDESCAEILDGIVKSHIETLRRDLRYSASGASGI